MAVKVRGFYGFFYVFFFVYGFRDWFSFFRRKGGDKVSQKVLHVLKALVKTIIIISKTIIFTSNSQVFVGGLQLHVKKDALIKMFSEVGEVSDCWVARKV